MKNVSRVDEKENTEETKSFKFEAKFPWRDTSLEEDDGLDA